MTGRICGAILAALMLWATPAAAQSVSIKDPAAFWATLKAMGYAPSPLAEPGAGPEMKVDIDGMATIVGLAGCTDGRNCRYMTLLGAFSDVNNPPQDWIQSINDRFDLMRVGNDDGSLYLFGAHFVEGLPQAQLRLIFDYWSAGAAEIGQDAIDKGHAAE